MLVDFWTHADEKKYSRWKQCHRGVETLMLTMLKLLDAWWKGEGFDNRVFDRDLFERKKFEGEIERGNEDR